MRRYRHTTLVPLVGALCFCISSAKGQRDISASLKQACGPSSTKFSVRINDSQPPMPESSSASSRLIVFPEAIVLAGCRYATRVGVDGKWLGATCLGGFLVSDLSPGDHHLCVNLQQKTTPDYTALHGLTVEPGRTYYFRAEIIDVSGFGPSTIHLERLDEDEGRLLSLLRQRSESKELR
jgi:hypothetical protein